MNKLKINKFNKSPFDDEPINDDNINEDNVDEDNEDKLNFTPNWSAMGFALLKSNLEYFGTFRGDCCSLITMVIPTTDEGFIKACKFLNNMIDEMKIIKNEHEKNSALEALDIASGVIIEYVENNSIPENGLIILCGVHILCGDKKVFKFPIEIQRKTNVVSYGVLDTKFNIDKLRELINFDNEQQISNPEDESLDILKKESIKTLLSEQVRNDNKNTDFLGDIISLCDEGIQSNDNNESSNIEFRNIIDICNEALENKNFADYYELNNELYKNNEKLLEENKSFKYEVEVLNAIINRKKEENKNKCGKEHPLSQNCYECNKCDPKWRRARGIYNLEEENQQLRFALIKDLWNQIKDECNQLNIKICLEFPSRLTDTINYKVNKFNEEIKNL
jgi:hypothetical protein